MLSYQQLRGNPWLHFSREKCTDLDRLMCTVEETEQLSWAEVCEILRQMILANSGHVGDGRGKTSAQKALPAGSGAGKEMHEK